MIIEKIKHGFTALSILATIVAAPSAGLSAEEAPTRFNADDFLQSLDLFIAQQEIDKKATALRMSNSLISKNFLSSNSPTSLMSQDGMVSLKKRDKKNGPGFFYLHDVEKNSAPEGTNLSGRPDFTSLLAPMKNSYERKIFGNNNKNILSGTTRMGVTFAKDSELQDGPHGFEVALQSSFNLSQNMLVNNEDPLLMDRELNVGLSFGYSGFNIDANLLQKDSIFSQAFSGYDMGFSYRTSSFWTRLSFTQIKREKDLFGFNALNDHELSVELGAGYRFSHRLSVNGGLRYADYDSFNNGIRDYSSVERAQMVFFGGRLDF